MSAYADAGRGASRPALPDGLSLPLVVSPEPDGVIADPYLPPAREHTYVTTPHLALSHGTRARDGTGAGALPDARPRAKGTCMRCAVAGPAGMGWEPPAFGR
jgi:hypothetical protein